MKLKGVVLSVFSFAVLFSGILFASGGIMPGAGTQADPYRIEDLADFQAFCGNSAYWAAGVYTQLDADIDLSSVGAYTTAPIGPSSSNPFAGNFDGNGHVISNLIVTGSSYLGLFGYINSTGYITRLGIESASITSTTIYNNVGGLVGYNNSGQISQCYVDGVQVAGADHDAIGGLCGYSKNGTIVNCYSSGIVHGGSYTGGLCGYTYSGTIISSSYSSCQVTGGGAYVGGLIGTNIGGTVLNCYFYRYGGRDNGLGTALDDMQIQANYGGFSFPSVWSIVSGHYPKLSYQTTDGPGPLALTETTTLSGSGSVEDPFLIGTYDDLTEFRNNSALRSGYYLLTSDINLQGLTLSESFVPQRFAGMFDGNGHVISNFVLNGSANSLGFFSLLDGYIARLGIESASVTGTGDYIGGLVGNNNYGQISQCYSIGVQVSGRQSTGGLCGENYHGTIVNCYSANTVRGNGTNYNGGFCGRNNYGTITNCYSSSQVTGIDSTGGFCGNNYYGTINNCYFYRYGGRDNGLGTALDDMQIQANYAGFGFPSVWSIVSGHYPKLSYQTSDGPGPLGLTETTTLSGSGSVEDPFLIGTYDDLIEFRNNSALRSGCYQLTADIDLQGIALTESFVPQHFAGMLDGNGHVISNFILDSTSYLGFFSILDGYITRLGIESASITGTGDYVGGLAGYSNYGQISQCYSIGVQVSGRQSTGGLCGENYHGTIVNCYSANTVSGNGTNYNGGFCGRNNYGTITNCYSSSQVTGNDRVGGFCGENYYGTINNCYWDADTDGISGTISGSNNYGATGKSTVEMQTLSTFTDAGWSIISDDISGVWYMFAGDYPCLSWEVVVVPDVEGIPYEEAESVIDANGLFVGAVTHVYSFTVASGSIISQSVAAGEKISHRTKLDLVVSRGPELTIVPDVVNKTQTEAVASLTNAKLVTNITHGYSFTVPAGSVISQSIAAGETIIINRVVDIVISDGPEMATVPNVSGMAETQAVLALFSAKLAIGTITHAYNATVPSGDVISQSVASGTSVVITSTVNLVISDGPEMVGVPSLYDMYVVEAQAVILMNNLTVGNISYAYSFTVAQGNVLAQSVAGGGSAVIGSPINLVVSQGPQIVTVPNLSSKTQAQAQAEIVSAGLLVGTVTQHYSPTIASGIVMYQSDQAGGNILIGSFINLVVSKGPEMTTVPSVVNLSQAHAEATLRAADLAVGTITTAYSFTVPAGNVISQSIAGGQAAAVETAVGLVISAGPEMTTVPDVTNMTEADAGTALANAKLTVGVKTSAHSLTVPAGSIISQSIAAGQSVVINTAINMVVSDGSMVSVPNVVNMEQALAGSALTSAWLAVGVVTTDYSATVPAGYVISQSIEAGQSVVFNTAVDLVVSDGIEMVAVPNIENKTQAQAQSALLSAGLAIGNVTLEKSFTVAQGSVISQGIADGEIIAAGTAIDMVVSNGSDFIDMLVFSQLAQYWQNTGCSQGQNCARIDFNTDGVIDAEDLLLLSDSWLSSDGILVPSVIADYFETGDFGRLDWQFGGNGDWSIAENELYRGKYAAKSGAVSDNQSSEMTLTVDTTGFDTIRFSCKVSSELDYDYLMFYIDGKRKGSFSGQNDWSVNSYSLTPGVHTFKWSYLKDETMNEGSDCAWIDDVVIFKAE